MRRIEKSIIPVLWVFIVFLSGYNFASAEQRQIELDFSNQTLSVTIKNASLRSVIAKIEKEEGVLFKLWLKGNESVLEERVSLKFENLSVQEGLERIFSPLNHCLIFDQNDKLLGVVLFGKPDPRRDRSRRRRVTPRRTPRR